MRIAPLTPKTILFIIDKPIATEGFYISLGAISVPSEVPMIPLSAPNYFCRARPWTQDIFTSIKAIDGSSRNQWYPTPSSTRAAGEVGDHLIEAADDACHAVIVQLLRCVPRHVVLLITKERGIGDHHCGVSLLPE